MSNFTVPIDQLNIEVRGDALATYQFGTFVAKHHFCRICGIFTFVETRFAPGEYRINLGCIHDLDTTSLPVENYDGANLE